MRIYLTEHGLAVPKDVDPNRPLSKQGRVDVRRLADFLNKAGVGGEHYGRQAAGLFPGAEVRLARDPVSANARGFFHYGRR